MSLAAPRICCLDLDTFFVSVERLLDPRLIGKPVVVGGVPGHRGVVTSASYEVRALGVRAGMPMARAVALAPHAIYVPTRGAVYGAYADRVRAIAARYTPVCQVASIDEMYLDFSGCERLYARPGDAHPDVTIERIVRALTDEIEATLRLPSSAGVAASRPVAKIACGLAKPRGVLLVPRGSEAALLAPLPARKLPGIGPVAERKLQALGITTLGELAASSPARLREVFGAHAEYVQGAARGEGAHLLGRERPAFQEHDPDEGVVGSISNERTFHADVREADTVNAMLCALCERVCFRARKRGVLARTVSLKLRYADFHTLTRARRIAPTCSELELLPVLRALFAHARTRRDVPIRLLGVSLSGLQPERRQLSLFDGNAPLHRAVDGARARYGYDAVRLARGARSRR